MLRHFETAEAFGFFSGKTSGPKMVAPLDMFPRTDTIKNSLQTSIPSSRPTLSA